MSSASDPNFKRFFCQVQEATNDLSRYEQEGNTLAALNTASWLGERAKYLVTEIERLRSQLLAGPDKVLRCAFCGHEYASGTPATKHELLTSHVRQCPEHPLRKELDALVDACISYDSNRFSWGWHHASGYDTGYVSREAAVEALLGSVARRKEGDRVGD